MILRVYILNFYHKCILRVNLCIHVHGADPCTLVHIQSACTYTCVGLRMVTFADGNFSLVDTPVLLTCTPKNTIPGEGIFHELK